MEFQKDYLLRLMETFFDALNRIIFNIERNDIEEAKKEINDTYQLLDGDVSFFMSRSMDEILDHFKHKGKDFLKKTQLLGELLFIDSSIENERKVKLEKLKKSKIMFEYYNRHSKEYSFEVDNKLSLISKSIRDSL